MPPRLTTSVETRKDFLPRMLEHNVHIALASDLPSGLTELACLYPGSYSFELTLGMAPQHLKSSG